MKWTTQLSPKLFVIEKSVLSKTYFASRRTSYDNYQICQGGDVFEISRWPCFFKWNYMFSFSQFCSSVRKEFIDLNMLVFQGHSRSYTVVQNLPLLNIPTHCSSQYFVDTVVNMIRSYTNNLDYRYFCLQVEVSQVRKIYQMLFSATNSLGDNCVVRFKWHTLFLFFIILL